MSLSTSQLVLMPPSGVHGFSQVTVPAKTYGGGLFYDTAVPTYFVPIASDTSTLCVGSFAQQQSDIPSAGTYILFAMCEGLRASGRTCHALILESGVVKCADLSSAIALVHPDDGKWYVQFPYAFFKAHYFAEAYF